MGIPSYFNDIIQKFQYIYKHINTQHIDELYIDANSIIYDCLRDILDNGHNEVERNNILREIKKNPYILYEKTRLQLEQIIHTIKPSFVFIAFDGVVPIAKMKQQRERRFKGAITHELTHFIDNKTTKYDGIDHNLFHTVEITPGTEFMNGLNEYFITSKLEIEHHIEVMFSLSDQPGEGEHKICEYLRKHKNNKHCAFYGLDADLFILALNHLQYRKSIMLVREQPSYMTILHDIYEENEFVCISINTLAEKIIDIMFQSKIHREKTSLVKKKLITDYVFLSFFAGNDFLPHLFGLSLRRCGFDILLDVYNQVLNQITDVQREKHTYFVKNDNTISWSFMKCFFDILSKTEDKLVNDEIEWLNRIDTKIIHKYKGLNTIDKINNIPCIHREKEKYVSVRSKNWKMRYYEMINHSIQHTKSNKNKIKNYTDITEDMCWNYIQGLYWVLQYYSGQNNIHDIHWYYKFNDAPLISSIYEHIPTMDIHMFNERKDILKLKDISHYTQLMYVLPATYHYLLPNNVVNILYTHYPVLKYAKGWVDTFLKRYFWEGSVIIPDIDFKMINSKICGFT